MLRLLLGLCGAIAVAFKAMANFPTQTITNPNNAWQTGATWQTEQSVQQEVIDTVNTSGAVRTAGDVVVLDLTTIANYGQLATTSATVNDRQVLGVVAPKAQGSLGSNADTYAAGATMPVIIKGPARINIAANVVAAGDLLTPSGVAGVAATNAGAPAANAVVGSIIGVAAEASGAKDANNTIRAYINKM